MLITFSSFLESSIVIEFSGTRAATEPVLLHALKISSLIVFVAGWKEFNLPVSKYEVTGTWIVLSDFEMIMTRVADKMGKKISQKDVQPPLFHKRKFFLSKVFICM